MMDMLDQRHCSLQWIIFTRTLWAGFCNSACVYIWFATSLLTHTTLYVANLGDSKAVLCPTKVTLFVQILLAISGKHECLYYIKINCDWILVTNQIVILGLFHFIGPANGYTHNTLPIHSTITRLGYIVYFTRASFANHVNSQLQQQDPWKALNGMHWFEIDPSGSETSLRPSKHVWAYGWHFLD